MISIKAIGASTDAHLYYAKYCQEKGEAQGSWVGEGASALGLLGKEVDADDMGDLLRGFSPLKEPLCQNAGDEHRGGWDLTFSAPKSFSCVWAASPEPLRLKFEAALREAAQISWQYFQDNAAYTRTGKGGHRFERADLVGSMFLHSSNRDGEPQAHVHIVTMNVARARHDGKFRTLDGQFFFKAQMAASAIFKAELAHRVRSLGFKVSRTKDSFEIEGVSQAVMDSQSSRSKEIEKELKKRGLSRSESSSELLEYLTLKTRKSKEDLEKRRDFPKWQKELSLLGFDQKYLENIQDKGKDLKLSMRKKVNLSGQCLDEITTSQSTFDPYKLHRSLAESSITHQGAKGIHETIELTGNLGELLRIRLGQTEIDTRYTTKEMFELEQKMVFYARRRKDEAFHVVKDRLVNKILKNKAYKTILPEQKKAALHITQGRDGVSLVRGLAGTGKSYTMALVREVYEAAGYEPIGLSPTNKAAQELEKASKIKSSSIHSFLIRLGYDQDFLTRKHVIIVDEGAMGDSRLLYALNQVAYKKKAKLVYIGDEKQIQPILAGQAFGSMYKTLGGVELTEVFRQERVDEAKAIKKIRDGHVYETLSFYRDLYSIPITENEDFSPGSEKIELFYESRKTGFNKKSVVFTAPLFEAPQLCVGMRDELKKNGYLEQGGVTASGLEVCKNEELICTKDLPDHLVYKGDRLKVLKTGTTDILAQDLEGKKHQISLSHLGSFQYGYIESEISFLERKKLHLCETALAAKESVIKRWRAFERSQPKKTSLIITSTNKAVDSLNALARIELKKEKKLGKSIIVKKKEEEAIEVSVGDRLIFTKSDKPKGVYRSTIGEVLSVSRSKIELKTPSRTIEVDPREFSHFKHAYAVTAHKSQGSTIDRGFIFLDSSFFDREKFYVALSRARNMSEIFYHKDLFGDLDDQTLSKIKKMKPEQKNIAIEEAYLRRLAFSLEKSSMKDTSQDYGLTEIPKRSENKLETWIKRASSLTRQLKKEPQKGFELGEDR